MFIFYSTFRTHLCFAADTISSGQSLNYSQTLISKGGKFELGFFKPGTSLNYYIGIWYKNISIQTVVWVANRDTPLADPSSSELKLLEYGNLVLLNESKIVIWSTDLMSKANVSSEAVLGDDGNLVLRTRVTPSDVVWQSFDYPTDTFLPGAKIGYDRITNKQQSLTSWKNSNDPAKGLYSLKLDPDGNQFFIESNQNRCLNGFEPKSPKDWNLNYFSGGCMRRASLQCGDEDSGSCLLWDGDLFNLQQFQDGDGAVLSIQIRLAASETPSLGGEIEGMM
ncbi:G-type lectin S-receptor-like serine/threonine-protein kinase [Thalictrum thalictroides]|uniref:G-type lectin S-receptor-like serine/threonine-protein kinase n=1 Tax=Thalictrum thalictroides TaxID=46969 RepID=A0A7J6V3Q0_THATH|nr:G-type lectin S-receptor-like serine/threonine-protein kinase [Thalictrum thalictroides]